jgi:hypothetical protein
MHITLRWTAFALAAAGLFLGAACGSDSDDDVATTPAAPSAADVSGSDQHLHNLGDAGAVNRIEAGNRAAARANADAYAEQQAARAAEAAEAELAQEQANAAASARLGGYAEQYAQAHSQARVDNPGYVYGGGSRALQVDDAEAIDRQAHLDGQARTYGP